jgi:hypothetical protein
MKATRIVPLATFVIAGLFALGRGVTGNDIGGIIPWTPENEWHADAMAQWHCARFNKYARVTSIVRGYGNYIGFECVWSPLARP